jgi:hypothetical protein
MLQLASALCRGARQRGLNPRHRMYALVLHCYVNVHNNQLTQKGSLLKRPGLLDQN